MKQCLLCGSSAEVDVPTCPNDGEASWSEPTAKPEPKPEPKVDPVKKLSAPRK